MITMNYVPVYIVNNKDTRKNNNLTLNMGIQIHKEISAFQEKTFLLNHSCTIQYILNFEVTICT